MHPILNRRVQPVRVAALVAFIASAGNAQATDRIYTLFPYTFDDSRFAFSGTITTDGSIGRFSDASFIKDWSIIVVTPSDVDGIATETFTPATGPLLRAYSGFGFGCDCLLVTESFISILSDYPNSRSLNLGIGDAGVDPTSIGWNGPFNLRFGLEGILIPGGVGITDLGESPQSVSHNFDGAFNVPVAEDGVAVPESSALFLLIVALAAMFARRCTDLVLRTRVPQIGAAMFPLVAFAASAQADIFQWEYINPADPSQGKQQSTTLAPDGAGINAVPGAELADLDLTMAYLVGADLRNAKFTTYHATCPGTLAACFPAFTIASATLSDADFTDSDIRGASFRTLTLTQLYSTASYRTRDLTGIELSASNLTGGNFADQNLSNAIFLGSTLTDAIFTNAQVTQAYFGKEVANAGFCGFPPCSPWIVGTGISPAQLYSTADYQAQNLSGINFTLNDLTGANFRGQNLKYASFSSATLTDADFTDADIRGADFNKSNRSNWGTGITLPQLYSTASYRAKDLSGIDLRDNALAGGNFVGQNLAYARLYDAQLTGADFTAADTRGALMYSLSAVSRDNVIQPFGHINGLDLGDDDLLVVRDFDGNPIYGIAPIPITIDQHLWMGLGGTLRMVFEADAWDSTISFGTGIPVKLGGTLELTFAADVNLASQVGRTFDLFDWTGVNPTGVFAVSSHYAWDLSELYTTGQVTLRAVPEPACLALAVTAIGIAVLSRRRCRIRTPIHVAQSQTICGVYA